MYNIQQQAHYANIFFSGLTHQCFGLRVNQLRSVQFKFNSESDNNFKKRHALFSHEKMQRQCPVHIS